MVVIGIDLGTKDSVISAARKGGVEVVVNDLSKRMTPSVVSFGAQERYIGDAGFNQLTFNAENSVTGIKHLIGKKYSQIKDQIERFPFKIVCGDNDSVLIQVRYLGVERSFRPVQVLGMLFQKFRIIAEQDTNDQSACSAVVSVPGYFDEEQRRVVIQACEIANITLLRLISEAGATAIVYGVYCDLLKEKDVHNVVLIDFGHGSTSVSVIGFTKSKYHILSSAFNRELGAGKLEDLLFSYFVEETKKKYKLDVLSNRKAAFRLAAACEKLKKVLSANSIGQLKVECLMNDIDVSFSMERSFFEEMCRPLLLQLQEPILMAIKEANLDLGKDIHSVQLIGGGSYIPVVRETVSKILSGFPVSSTMNATESISRGAGICAALLSSKFTFSKDKQFTLVEPNYYPIELGWKVGEGGDENTCNKTSLVFKHNDIIPSSKLLRFKKTEDFNVFANYPPSDNNNNIHHRHNNNNSSRNIAKFSISGITSSVAKGKKLEEIKVKIGLNRSGCIEIESAQQVEEVEYWEEVKQPVATTATAATATTGGGNAGTPMDTPPSSATGTPATPSSVNGGGIDATMSDSSDQPEPQQPKKVLKKKSVISDLTVVAHLPQYSAKEMKIFKEEERKMKEQDDLIIQTSELKNSIEAYIYDMQPKIDDDNGELVPYFDSQDRITFKQKLEESEAWLSGDGSNATKEIYKKVLDELTQLGLPAAQRMNEDQKRPALVAALNSLLEEYTAFATSQDPKYAHIGQEDRDKVLRKCAETRQWLSEQLALQEKIPRHLPPVLIGEQIKEKQQQLMNVCNNIRNKPKPAVTTNTNNTQTPEEQQKKNEEQQQQPTKNDEKMDTSQ